jgi:hypothetical protein
MFLMYDYYMCVNAVLIVYKFPFATFKLYIFGLVILSYIVEIRVHNQFYIPLKCFVGSNAICGANMCHHMFVQ